MNNFPCDQLFAVISQWAKTYSPCTIVLAIQLGISHHKDVGAEIR